MTKLELGTSNHNNLYLVGLGLQVEEISEKFEMRLDAQKSFAQIHEDSYVEDGVRGQVVCLNLPVVEKAREKLGSWNCKFVFQEGSKSDDFACIFIWATMAHGRTPLDHVPMQKTIVDKGLELGFCALTVQPSVVQGGARACGVLVLPLHGFLRRHSKGNWSLHADTLGAPPVVKVTERSRTGRHLGESEKCSRIDLLSAEVENGD